MLDFPIHVYSQAIITTGLSFSLTLIIALGIFLILFTEKARFICKHSPAILISLFIITFSFLGIAAIQQNIKRENIRTELKYANYAIVITAKGDSATPSEITTYNTTLDKLIIFQTEHPECLSGSFDWTAYPHITPKD